MSSACSGARDRSRQSATIPLAITGSFVSLLLFAGPAHAYAQQPGRDTTQTDTTRTDTTHVHTLPPVRVVAPSSPRADAASAVLIQPEAIRTTPATNVWDIVRQTAGVEVHQQGQGPGFASDAVIRGFTSDHSTDVAIMLDGVPLNQPVNGHAEGYADWNEIMPEAVSSIEVLKGPVSPWIGNFGMGGELDVKTVPVAVGTRWSLRTGSYGDARLTALTGNASENGGFVLAGDAQREDGWRPNSRSSMEHLLFSRTWQHDTSSTTTLAASGYAAQWDSPGFLTLDQFDQSDLDVAVDRTDGGRTAAGLLRGSIVRPMRGGLLRSQLYARAGQWHIFLNIPPEGGIGEGATSQTEELDRRLEAGGATRFEHQLGAVHFMAGADYRLVRSGYQRYFTTLRARDSVFDFDGVPARLDATYLSVAPAIEAHWDATPRLALGFGGRLDWMRYGMTPWDAGTGAHDSHLVATPKLSARYRLTPTVAVYAAFNGGFRSADGSVANPSLEPSHEWASEVGLRANSDRFEASVALFNVDVQNEQTFNDVTQETTAGGQSRRRGLELDGRLGLVPAVALFAHATINDAHYTRLVTDDGDDLSGKPVFGVARATVESGFDVEAGGVLGSVWAAYTGPFTPIGEPDARTSSHTLLNVRGSVSIGGPWSVALGMQNILDKKYAEVRASGFVSPGQPRTLLVTLRHGT